MKNMWSATQEPQELLLKAQGYLEIKAEPHNNTANGYHPEKCSCGWDNASKRVLNEGNWVS